MKTNIKVIGIMITLLAILTVGKTFAYADYPLSTTFDTEKSTLAILDNDFVALYTSSIDHNYVLIKLVQDDNPLKAYNYMNVIVGSWMTFTNFDWHSYVSITFKNNSSYTYNHISGTLRY